MLRPLYQSAACVAIVVLLGLGAQRSFTADDTYAFGSPLPYSEAYSGQPQNYHVFTEGEEMYQRTATVEADSILPLAPEMPTKTK